MGVPWTFVFYAGEEATANKAAAAAFQRVAELNRILSDYDPESELSRLSRSAPQQVPVVVSKDLWSVLKRSQELAQASDGAFDVTVGPYIRLWRRARRAKEMPSPTRLADAAESVGYGAVHLEPQNRAVRLARPNMRLDLGGIAMGYAADEALKVLNQFGINRCMVDASGDIAVGDPPPGEAGWKVGIGAVADGPPRHYIRLRNAAVTSSGDAFQHVEIDGKRYSHIVDPRTGFGLTDRSTVTIIAPDCFTADGLATTVSVLGPEKGIELVESMPGVAAHILRRVDKDGLDETRSKRFAELRFVKPAE
jgi:thiamine biosynthesis lipoprotein